MYLDALPRSNRTLSEHSLVLSFISLKYINLHLFFKGIIDLPESVKNCKCLEQFDASVNPIGK